MPRSVTISGRSTPLAVSARRRACARRRRSGSWWERRSDTPGMGIADGQDPIYRNRGGPRCGAWAHRCADRRSDDLEVALQFPVGHARPATAATPIRAWRRSGRRSRRRTSRARRPTAWKMRVVSISVRGARGMFSAPWLVPVIGLRRELQVLLDAVQARRRGTPPSRDRDSRRRPGSASRGASTWASRRITRKLAVRLSTPHVGFTGAQKPSTRRL